MICELNRNINDGVDSVIDEYGGYVYAIISNILKGYMPQEDIEEAVSDVFANLWRSSEKFDDSRPLKPYLAAMARNTAKNKLRSMSLNFSLDDDEISIPDRTDTIAEFEKAQQIEVINQGLKEMKADDREIFLRYYYNFEKLCDIAEKLGISQSNAKIRLHRARKKPKEVLAERGYDSED